MGLFQGSTSWPGGRAACWVLTHLRCSPREAELHPAALKWVTGSSHPLYRLCHGLGNAGAEGGTSWGTHGSHRISAYLREQEEAQEHLRDTCRDLSLFLAATSHPKQAGSRVRLRALAAPQMAHGRRVSHRQAVPPAPGANPALLPLTTLLLLQMEIPAGSRRPRHVGLWSRPKAVTSGVPCHSKGCASVPARTLLLHSSCSLYMRCGGGC